MYSNEMIKNKMNVKKWLKRTPGVVKYHYGISAMAYHYGFERGPSPPSGTSERPALPFVLRVWEPPPASGAPAPAPPPPSGRSYDWLEILADTLFLLGIATTLLIALADDVEAAKAAGAVRLTLEPSDSKEAGAPGPGGGPSAEALAAKAAAQCAPPLALRTCRSPPSPTPLSCQG